VGVDQADALVVGAATVASPEPAAGSPGSAAKRGASTAMRVDQPSSSMLTATLPTATSGQRRSVASAAATGTATTQASPLPR
jgi:hypothetical protein